MMAFLQGLPHLEAYGDPQYFIYLILAVLPIFIGLFFKKRFLVYELAVSFLFICLMLTGHHFHQVISLILYVVWEMCLVAFYYSYRQKKNSSGLFYLLVVLAILPLAWVKVAPSIDGHQSLFGFLGISYVTFRVVGTIIELRDGVIKDFNVMDFLTFMLFMPTFSSGPIDHFKRFRENYKTIPEREELLGLLEESVKYIMLGFLYKFILAYIFGRMLLPPLREMALSSGGFFNLGTLGVMYTFGFDLFFDFAGYSMFALAISNLMGIRSPINFNKPFLSHNLKEFWNRWHMSLSFWFRDFVFMRLVMFLMKKKVMTDRVKISYLAYIVNMLLMGFWHGLTWYYITYGLFHGIGLVINDAWLNKKKVLNKERRKKNLPPLPENKWTKCLGIVVTFHVVMLSFLIFSGFLEKLWF